jgi:hypothetical protein
MTDVNDPFTITDSGAASTWTEDTAAGQINSSIVLADEDAVSTPLNNGRIWMQIESWASGDRLVMTTDTNANAYRVRVDEVNQIDDLYVREGETPVQIGTTLGTGKTFGTAVLDIQLTANATLPRVQTFLRNVLFENPT